MKFIGPYGVPSGSPYVQGDAAANIEGSWLDIRAITDPMGEILYVIQQAGLTPSDTDLTQLYQAIQAQILAAIAATAAPAGAVMGFDLAAPPTGWIAGDGSAILRASYTRLDTAKYVGDANNATATAWYRCTNPSSPSTSRSTTGAYLVTRDLRGVFTRFLDSGAGIDTGRVLGSLQKGTLIYADTTGSPDGRAVGSMGIDTPTPLANFGIDTIGSGDLPSTFYSAGGVNTVAPSTSIIGAARPINISLLGCIKY